MNGSLNRTATLADVGHVAAFVASDRARTITATEVNISRDAMMDEGMGREAPLPFRRVIAWPIEPCLRNGWQQ